jgi:hypothetical protein
MMEERVRQFFELQELHSPHPYFREGTPTDAPHPRTVTFNIYFTLKILKEFFNDIFSLTTKPAIVFYHK